MSTREMASHMGLVAHVAAVAITATNTPSAGVDTRGYDAVTFLINVGIVTNIGNSPQPTWAFHVEESDAASSGFAAITDSERIAITGAKSPVTTPNSSTGVFLTIDAAAEDATVYHVGVITSKRYVRVVATAANSPGSTPYAVSAILTAASVTPVIN